jgi:hypothetical protein
VVAADIGFRTSSGGQGVWYGAGAILVVTAAALIAGALAMRRRQLAKSAARTPAAESSRSDLIDQVARLDESFDTGGLDRAAYEAERSALMARLKEQRAESPAARKETRAEASAPDRELPAELSAPEGEKPPLAQKKATAP